MTTVSAAFLFPAENIISREHALSSFQKSQKPPNSVEELQNKDTSGGNTTTVSAARQQTDV